MVPEHLSQVLAELFLMAIEFMQAVWEISPYKAEKLLVQLACADWANHDGEFWPTYEEIARKTRLTKPGTIGVIQQLIEDGEIELVEKSSGGRGNRNRYRFSEDYLEAVEKVRTTWAAARERKGKRGLPNSQKETVNEDDRFKMEKVNEDDEKGKREPAHIRKNRHEPSERERDASFVEESAKPKLALVSSVDKPTPAAEQPFSPSDDFSQAAPATTWTVAERFILKACHLWDELANQEKPVVELNWKTKCAVQAAARFVTPRLNVKARIGGTPAMFLEFWHDTLRRTVAPRPEYVVEQWEAYDRWLIENHETHRRVAA